MPSRKNLPTDYQILDLIYERYYDVFAAFDKAETRREGKTHVPINIQALAKELEVDGDIVFGRLYYHLENKYGYKSDDDSRVCLFALKAAEERHAVNFPYLASVLAELRDEGNKFKLATKIAAASLIVSVISICVSILRA